MLSQQPNGAAKRDSGMQTGAARHRGRLHVVVGSKDCSRVRYIGQAARGSSDVGTRIGRQCSGLTGLATHGGLDAQHRRQSMKQYDMFAAAHERAAAAWRYLRGCSALGSFVRCSSSPGTARGCMQ